MTHENSNPSNRSTEVDSYLWDRTGQPDPEVVGLENVLGELRGEPLVIKLDEIEGSPIAGPFTGFGRRRTFLAAAGVLLTIGAAIFAAIMLLQPNPAPGWSAAAISGTSRIGQTVLGKDGTLAIGEWLRTDAASRAEIKVADIGRVTVDANTSVRLVRTAANEHRLELGRGRIEALITAPPRVFFVDTPAATAVDLGCRYSLAMDEQGNGELEVTLGWVALERDGREMIVPRGAKCRTVAKQGPGTPFYADASPDLQRELQRFDFEAGGDESIKAVLDSAQSQDSLTLWHLLARVDGEQRRQVAERLNAIFPCPANVDLESVIRGDQASLSAWRDHMPWSPLP